MKKRYLFLALAVCLMTVCCGCTQQAPVGEPSSDAVATTTADIPTTTPTTTPTTQAIFTNDEPSVNTALFSEIGMTFAQLSETYGEVSKAFYESGGPVYSFENTTQFYSFDGSYEVEGGYDSIPLTEDGYWDMSAAPLPEDDDVCTGIYYATTSVVFTELGEPVTSTELARLYRLGEPDCSQSMMTEQYIAAFEADGYRIRIICEDETYTIRPDAYVHIVPAQQ